MSGSMTILHQLPYKPRGKATHSWARATFDFSEAGRPGANLATALGGTLTLLDGKEDLFFQGCGQKVTYHILCPPHDHFHVQKWVKRLKNGCKMPITREKVVCQVAEVVMAFIESISDGKDSLGSTPKFNGVPFDEIYLLRLEQFGSSFQPVLGRLRVEEQPTSLAQPTISLPLAQPYPPHLSAAIDHRFGYPAGSSSGSVAPANMPCQVYPVDPFSYFGSGTPFDRNPALWWSGESGSGASQQEGYGAQDAAPDPRLCFSRLNMELPFAPDNFQDPGGSPTYGTFGFRY